jgi:hypothetical protein
MSSMVIFLFEVDQIDVRELLSHIPPNKRRAVQKDSPSLVLKSYDFLLGDVVIPGRMHQRAFVSGPG